MAKHDIWMRELYYTLLNADLAYPAGMKLDDDPVKAVLIANAEFVGLQAYFALAKMIGCAIVAQSGLMTIVGRETNIAYFQTYARKLQSGRLLWPAKAEAMRRWCEYDDDFDVPVEDRRSTILAPKRAMRVAADNVAWVVSGTFPQLRNWSHPVPTECHLLPHGGPYRLGGLLPLPAKDYKLGTAILPSQE